MLRPPEESTDPKPLHPLIQLRVQLVADCLIEGKAKPEIKRRLEELRPKPPNMGEFSYDVLERLATPIARERARRVPNDERLRILAAYKCLRELQTIISMRLRATEHQHELAGLPSPTALKIDHEQQGRDTLTHPELATEAERLVSSLRELVDGMPAAEVKAV